MSYWNACEKIIDSMPDNISVNYKGELNPNDVIDTFSKYHLFFFPTKGENFGYVILESLMAGCPVIISDQTPWRGLAHKGIGADISLDKEEDFHTKLQDFVNLKDHEFQLFSRNAFETAKEYCDNKNNIMESRDLFFQTKN